MDSPAHTPPLADRIYVAVYGALLVLTAITVGVAYLPLGPWATAVALVVAGCKSSLVLWYFMGIRTDPPIFRWMLLFTLGTFVVFLVITYTDYLFR